jgi:hypothetical protein
MSDEQILQIAAVFAAPLVQEIVVDVVAEKSAELYLHTVQLIESTAVPS